MKKALALILALAVVMSLGIAAVADGSPSKAEESATVTAPQPVYLGPALNQAQKSGFEVCNAEEKVIAEIPEKKVTQVVVGEADKLEAADEEAFLATYEDVKAIENKVVKYFYWFQVDEKDLPEGWAFVKFPFTCTGENVQVTVNGKEMEVVNVEGDNYYAKLTEFGALAILCD